MSPGVVASTCIAAVLLLCLQYTIPESGLAAVARMVGGLGALGLFLMSLDCVVHPSRWARSTRGFLTALNDVTETPLPWFRSELSEEARRKLVPRAARQRLAALAPAIFLFVNASLLALLAVAVTVPGLDAGSLSLRPGDTVESYRAPASVDGRLSMQLGFRLGTSWALQADDGRWHARLHLTDIARGEDVISDLGAGRSVLARGLDLSFVALHPTQNPGRAILRVQRRGSEASVEEITVRVGGRTRVGESTLEVVEGSFAKLGLLGPALRIREFVGDEMLRDEWVFDRPGFDEAHGSGQLVVSIEGLEPEKELALGAWRRDGVAWFPLIVVLSLLAALALLLALPAYRLLRGRDGDWTLVVRGAAEGRRSASLRLWERELLSHDELQELASLRALDERSSSDGGGP